METSESKTLARQNYALYKHWESKKENFAVTQRCEENWAFWVRTKYDALVGVGFKENEALEITIASLRGKQ